MKIEIDETGRVRVDTGSGWHEVHDNTSHRCPLCELEEVKVIAAQLQAELNRAGEEIVRLRSVVNAAQSPTDSIAPDEDGIHARIDYLSKTLARTKQELADSKEETQAALKQHMDENRKIGLIMEKHGANMGEPLDAFLTRIKRGDGPRESIQHLLEKLKQSQG